MTNSLSYLASPYSHPEAVIRKLRFQAVARVAARLAYERGVFTFSPIAHSHPISEEMEGKVDPTNHDFWLRWDKPFAEMCAELIVCTLPGWEESKGVNTEMTIFEKANKRVNFLDPRGFFTWTEWKMLQVGDE